MCERCSLGYYPNQNKTECLPTPSDESNCSAFGTVRCVRCPAGFFLDPDASFKRLVSASRTAEEIYLATTGRQPLASPPACMPIEIANCETGTAASNCTKCISGFELASTGRCIPVQLPSVVKCASYGRDGGCLTCITGYHPVSSNNCTANDPIPNCASYSTSSRHTECLRCESGYLVSNTNVCEASSTPVPTNCAETNPRTGECVTCAAGFALASDRSCVTAVEGCASYSPAGCTACGRGRVLTSGLCPLGTITNCAIYDSNGDCSVCEGAFYLSGNVCQVPAIPAGVAARCAKMSSSTECAECAPLSAKSNIKNICVEAATSRPHCAEMGGTGECVTCKNYYTLVDGVCRGNNVTGCILEDGAGACTTCDAWSAASGGVCQSTPPLFFAHCATGFAKTASGPATCQACKPYSAPVVLSGRGTVCGAAPQSVVAGCAAYYSSTACRRCESGLALQEATGSCVDEKQCATGRLSLRLLAVDGVAVIRAENQCLTAESVAGCGVYVPLATWDATGSSEPTLVCAECRAGFFAVVDPPLQKGQAHGFREGSASPGELFLPIKACVAKTEAFAGAQLVGFDLSNCELLAPDTWTFSNLTTTTVYGCFKCKRGYTGVPRLLVSRSLVQFCAPLDACNGAAALKGLGGLPGQLSSSSFPTIPLETYFSCLKCKDIKQIVISSAVSFDYEYVSAGKSLTEKTPDYAVFSYNSTVPASVSSSAFAFNVSKLTLCSSEGYIRSLDRSGQWPSQCGAALLLSNKPQKLPPSSDASVVCVACRPGFAAVMSTAAGLTFTIDRCVAIAHCRFSLTFNGCSYCEDGYLNGILPTGEADMSQCLPSPGSACLLVGGSGACARCKENHFLHFDSTCHPSTSATLRGFLHGASRSTSASMRPASLATAELRSRCAAPLVEISTNFAGSKVCLPRPPPISNCVQLSGTPPYVCLKCAIGYALSNTGEACLEGLKLANCRAAAANGDCSACLDTYILENGACVPGSVANCITYTGTTCSACATPLALLDGRCVDMTALGCAVLAAPTGSPPVHECTTCIDGFLKSTGTHTLCLPAAAPVPHCLTHSGVDCSVCESGYFLEKGLCQRLASIPGCRKPLDAATCSECEAGLRPDSRGMACLPNPQGVPHCILHRESGVCERCESPFLATPTGECERIPIERQIPGCAAYSGTLANLVCVVCSENFVLKPDKSCLESPGKNCLTYDDSFNCASCSSDSVLVDLASSRICERRRIVFCLEHISYQNQVFCLTCQTGYFVNVYGNCQEIKTALPDCETYSSSTLCRYCRNSRASLANQSFCEPISSVSNYHASECDSYVISHSLYCLRCKIGYYMNEEGECEKCQTGSECMYCDSKNPSVCLMCAFGMTMNDDKSCRGTSKISSLVNPAPIVPVNVAVVWVGVAVVSALAF